MPGRSSDMAGMLQRGLRTAGAWVNVPIYHALFPKRRSADRPLRRVGIFKADGLGDFILALGAIHEIVGRHGAENCVLITSPIAREFARFEFPNVELAVVKPFSGRLCKTRGILQELSETPLFQRGVEELISLRHHRYLHQDLLLASIPSRRSFGLQNPPNAFDREWARSRLVFDRQRNWPTSARPGWCLDLECHQALLEILPNGVSNPEAAVPRLAVNPGLPREAWAGVAPYGSHGLKDLPLPMLAELGRHLATRHQLSLRLLSAPSQLERLTADAAALRALGVPEVEVMLTPTMAALVEAVHRTRLLVSTDTGTAHLGGAANAPMIAFIGGAHHGIFAPWVRSERQRWLDHRLPCYGCNWQCIHPRALCITDIPTAEVLNAADKVLATQA